MTSKKTLFIIHGSYGNPNENWFPWLKKELESLGRQVFVPEFPIPKNKEGHSLEKWLTVFKEYKQYINEHTIFVAHSRGCSFLYQLIPILNKKIHSLFLVGGFVDYDQWRPEVYSKYDSFQSRPYLWKRIRKLVNYIEFFQSTNDVIPISEGQFQADWLHAKMTLVKNSGHFNVATYKHFTKFPLLLEHIKTRL